MSFNQYDDDEEAFEEEFEEEVDDQMDAVAPIKRSHRGWWAVLAVIVLFVGTLAFYDFDKPEDLPFEPTGAALEENFDQDDVGVPVSEEQLNAIFGEDLTRFTADLSHIYKDDSEFYSDEAYMIDTLLPKLEAFENQLNTAEVWKQFVKTYEEAQWILEKIYWYGNFAKSIDASNSTYQSYVNTGERLSQLFNETTAFYLPELASHDESTIREILNYEGMSVETLEREVESFFEYKAHMLSKESEEIVATLTGLLNTPKNVWDKITVLDPYFPYYALEDGTIIDFENEKQLNQLRRDSDIAPSLFEYAIMVERQNQNALAELLVSEVKKNIALAKIYNYDDFLSYGLSGAKVSPQVYLDLINSTEVHLETFQRSQRIKDEHQLWINSVDVYPIENAYKLLKDSYTFYGDTYARDFEFAANNRWFDLVAGPYKEAGAYVSGIKAVHPYMIMSYGGSLDDLFTLTHEYGHVANYTLSQKNVPGVDWTPQNFTAEIPSTHNEIVLSEYLKKQATTDDERLMYLLNEIDLIENTFFFQTLLAEFQYDIHLRISNGELLTADDLNRLYGALEIKYYGDFLEEFMYEKSSSYWMQVSHLYYGFYVYSYSTSIALAYDIYSKFEAGEITPEMYKTFLSLGSTLSPEDALNKLGVTLENNDWIEGFFDYYKGLVDELEAMVE